MGISTDPVVRADYARRVSGNDNEALSTDVVRVELARCRLRLQRAASQVAVRKWKARVEELEAALALARR